MSAIVALLCAVSFSIMLCWASLLLFRHYVTKISLIHLLLEELALTDEAAAALQAKQLALEKRQQIALFSLRMLVQLMTVLRHVFEARERHLSLPTSNIDHVHFEAGGVFMLVDGRYYRVDLSKILWVCKRKGHPNQLEIHTANRTYCFEMTLKACEERLPEQSFLAVHKSFIVNVEQIDYVLKDFSFLAINGELISVSKSRVAALRQRLRFF